MNNPLCYILLSGKRKSSLLVRRFATSLHGLARPRISKSKITQILQKKLLRVQEVKEQGFGFAQ
jgi:hypothetical protein